MSLRFSRSSVVTVSLLLAACSSSTGGAHEDAGGHPEADAGGRASHDSAAPDADAAHARDAASADAGSDGHASDSASIDAPRDQSASHEAGDAATDVATPRLDAANDPDGSTPDAQTDSGSPTDATTGTPPSPALRYVGRIERSDPAGPQFEWPGTEVIARFDGTGFTLNMTDYGNYFDVIVDGTLQPTPIIGASGTTAYSLISGLPTGTHEVILYRRTEASVSTTQILGQTVAGGALLPPGAAAARRIEVIGDSISCGFGALGVGPTCDPTNANEDHYVTYETVAGRALGADVITTAWSGKGVYENYGGSMTSTLPDLYPYTLPNEPGPGTLWDFTSWTPDVVVIDLGTNDFSNGDPGSGYETAYLALLRTVRGHYPNAYILCANGPLLPDPDFTTAAAYINGAVAQMVSGGDTNVAYLSFGIQSGTDGYGCDYHPNVATHAAMAVTLEQALEGALGW